MTLDRWIMLVGVAFIILGAILKAFDWPPIYGGVPYTSRRHHAYEWVTFLGWGVLIGGALGAINAGS